MNPAWPLHNQDQHLWLDNITRSLLTRGTLSRCVCEYAVSRLSSNPAGPQQAPRVRAPV